MKKWISLLLILVLFIPSLSVAAPSTLFLDNIHFGDSMDAVKTKEANNKLQEEYVDSLVYSCQYEGFDCTRNYYFDEDKNTLNNVIISFDFTNENASHIDKAILEEKNMPLKKALSSTYGNPLPTDDEHWKTFPGSGLIQASGLLQAYRDLSTQGETYDGGIISIDEWLLESEEYNMKIDLVTFCLSAHFDNTGATFYDYLTYIGLCKLDEGSNLNTKDAESDKEQDENNSIESSSSSANAVEITLHSGVQFGMTRDEVMKKEKAHYFTCHDENLQYAYYTKNGEYMGKSVSGLVVDGSIAGIPDSQVYYYFDENDKLFDVLYVFKRGTARELNEEILIQYETIENQLNQKYSNIWEDCLGDDFPSNVDAIDSRGIVYNHSAHKIRINENEYLYIYHRVSHAKLDDYDLGEEALLMGTGRHFLDYRIVKDDEIRTIKKSISEKEDKERKKQEDAEKEKQKQLDSDL